jgi:hypothetical protein
MKIIRLEELVFNQDGKYYPGTEIHVNEENIKEVKSINGMTQVVCKNNVEFFVKEFRSSVDELVK